MRTRSERRRLNVLSSLKKQKLYITFNYDDLHELHWYSKNGFHKHKTLSKKTKNKGKRGPGNYQASFNPSASYRRKLDRALYSEQDYFEV